MRLALALVAAAGAPRGLQCSGAPAGHRPPRRATQRWNVERPEPSGGGAPRALARRHRACPGCPLRGRVPCKGA